MIYHVRKESFGATIYNVSAVSYFFITDYQLDLLKNPLIYKTNEKITDIIKAQDLSNGNFEKLLQEVINKKDTKLIWKKNSNDVLPTNTIAAPIRIYFEITRVCNGCCTYCLNDSGSALQDMLSTDEMFKIIDTLGKDSVFEVRLTGGEVTLHPEYEALAKWIHDNGMVLSINSNLLVDKKILDRLIDLRPSLLVTSVDGTKESHCLTRGNGYEQIVSNIITLRNNQIPIRINCMIASTTIPYFEQFIDYFASLGCGFSFMLPKLTGRGLSHKELIPDLDCFYDIYQLIHRKKAEYPNNYFCSTFDCVRDKEFKINDIELTGCDAIQKSFSINSDGKMFPCAFCEFDGKSYLFGNIRDFDYSVLNVWRNSQPLMDLRRRSGEINKNCIYCNDFRKRCMGTCFAMVLFNEVTGHANPYCRCSNNI
jgi:MoaA/NifB/PqqE/SkfB family radical SAM enzyme